MLNLLALLAVALGVHVTSVSAGQPVGWSGTWTSRGSQDVQIVRVVPGSGSARGWNGFAEALVAVREYRIDIVQTADRVAIRFPGGASNMLTLDDTSIAPEPTIRVVNRGDWWTKHVTSAQSTADTLELACTSFSGWWRSGGPDDAKPRATDFRRRFVLTRGSDPAQLLLRVYVADEKGELEYVQTFRREP